MPIIKINEDFSIERDVSCWILYIYKDGVKRETKEKVRVCTELYPSTLMGCFNYILELTAGKANCLTEMRQLILDCKNDIMNAIGIDSSEFLTKIGGIDCAGHPRSSKDMETECRRSKGKSKGEESNNSNENEGVERKVQTEDSSGSGKVDKKGRGRTRKTRS